MYWCQNVSQKWMHSLTNWELASYHPGPSRYLYKKPVSKLKYVTWPNVLLRSKFGVPKSIIWFLTKFLDKNGNYILITILLFLAKQNLFHTTVSMSVYVSDLDLYSGLGQFRPCLYFLPSPFLTSSSTGLNFCGLQIWLNYALYSK